MTLNEILAHRATVLDARQRRFFHEEGYLALPGLLSADEVDSLRVMLGQVVEASRSETQSSDRFDLEVGHCAAEPRLRRATYIDDLVPEMWDFCRDSVVTDITADLLGPNIRFREVMANFKWARGGAEIKWHQDICFYPHTYLGTLQALVMLEDVTSAQGPVQVIPRSHKGKLYKHYDARGEWTGAIPDDASDLDQLAAPVELTGPAGTVTFHHCATIHGSAANRSDTNRPAFVFGFSAADAVAYTPAPYPSSHYLQLVRGSTVKHAAHDDRQIPLPPDWSAGYTSIFAHQDGR